MADGGSSDADTANACPSKTAAEGDICDRAVRLMKRCDCHRVAEVASSKVKPAIAINLIIPILPLIVIFIVILSRLVVQQKCRYRRNCGE